MEVKRFKKRIEDFICENCGYQVKGKGYTNHCPNCLWSKHLDINPGDRAEGCQGLMKPIRVEIKNQKYIIIHKCLRCGITKRNKASSDDNFDEILKIL